MRVNCPHCNTPNDSELCDAQKPLCCMHCLKTFELHAQKRTQDPYIIFACPGCAKQCGFPTTQAGKPAACPACKLRVMVPAESGGESFVVGGSIPAPAPQGVSLQRSLRNRLHVLRNERNKFYLPAMIAALGLVALVSAAAMYNSRESSVAAAAPVKQTNVAPPQQSAPTTFAKNETTLTAPHAVEKIAQTAPTPLAKPDAAPEPLEIAPSKTIVALAQPAPVDVLTLPDKKPHADDVEEESPPAKPLARTTPDSETILLLDQIKEPPPPAKATGAAEQPTPPTIKPLAPLPPPTIIPPAPTNAVRIGFNGEKIEPGQPIPPPPPKGMMPEPKRPEAPPRNPSAPVAPLELPAARRDCAHCQNLGLAPIANLRPYVRNLAEKTQVNLALLATPWRSCSACKQGPSDKDLQAGEMARLDESARAWERWNAVLKNGTGFETRHASLYVQLPALKALALAQQLDKLAETLQKQTNSVLLTQTRPDKYELSVVESRETMREIARDILGHTGLEMPAQASSVVLDKRVAIILNEPGKAIEASLSFQLGRFFIAEACENKDPAWLTEGFAAYCEQLVTKQNRCRTTQEDALSGKLSSRWLEEARTMTTKGLSRPWKTLLELDGKAMNASDSVSVYAITTFLIRSDGKRFAQMVAKLRAGENTDAALSGAYGRSVADLERMWAAWLQTAK